MRAVITHAPGADVNALRLALLGAGCECERSDVAPWEELSRRLAQGDIDLLVVKIDAAAVPNSAALSGLLSMTSVPKLAVGSLAESHNIGLAQQLGAMRLLDEANLDRELEAALEHLRGQGKLEDRRGKIISVLAPMPGSGGATVSVNLAAALAQRGERIVALIEYSPDPGKLALLLNVTPTHTIRDVCGRWQDLDQVGLRNSFTESPTGLRVLANRVDEAGNDRLSKDALRRMAMLVRVSNDYTVFCLTSSVHDACLETIQLSDTILLVLRPDVPSVRRAQWTCRVLEEGGVPRDRLELVVNRWGQRHQLDKEQIEFTLGMNIVEMLPDDVGRVNQATNEGKLLAEYGRSALVRRFEALADHCAGTATSSLTFWPFHRSKQP